MIVVLVIALAAMLSVVEQGRGARAAATYWGICLSLLAGIVVLRAIENGHLGG